MECPVCNSTHSKVIESRKVEMNTFRIRVCKDCNTRFYTEETVISKQEAREYMMELQRIYRKNRIDKLKGTEERM